MRILTASETRLALPMADAIRAMGEAFAPDATSPLRQLVGKSMVMPGTVAGRAGVKVVSTVPGNPAGIVVLFDDDGAPIGVVDGPTITAIRTAAGAGLVTDLLAPIGAVSMAMIGAGAMARDQVLAVQEVRDISRLVVWSRDPSRAGILASEFGGEVALSPAAAVTSADIVTTATPSKTPLFEAADLREEVHVNAIGAFTADMAEIPAGFIERALVVVDDMGAAAAEAGDLIQANRAPDMDVTTLLTMRTPLDSGATLFKSVGIASQDVAAAAMALDNAESLGLGTTVQQDA